MKTLIFTLFTLFLLSSCASISEDDQFASFSSDTNNEIFVVEIYNRGTDSNAVATIRVQDAAQQDIILDSKQVATVFLDKLDAGKNEPILVFILPSGEEVKTVLPSDKTIKKSEAPQLNDKVYICIENGAVSQLSSEDWYAKLNEDIELNSTEKLLMVVTAPITIPVFLVSYMAVTLVEPFVD